MTKYTIKRHESSVARLEVVSALAGNLTSSAGVLQAMKLSGGGGEVQNLSGECGLFAEDRGSPFVESIEIPRIYR